MSTKVAVETKYSREELYTLVLSEPMLKIAEKASDIIQYNMP